MFSDSGRYGKLLKWPKIVTITALLFLVMSAFIDCCSTTNVLYYQNEKNEVQKIEFDNSLMDTNADLISIPGHGSRGNVIEKEPNNEWNEAIKTGNSFSNDSILVGSANGNDVDIFFTSIINWPMPGKVHNITINPSTFSGFNSIEDWIVVQLWQWWDFDGNGRVDAQEAIILHQESYNPWFTYDTCWAYTSELTYYFVRVEGQPKDPSTTLNYDLEAFFYSVTPDSNDTSYSIENAAVITKDTPIKGKVDMDYKPFDWYRIDPVYISGREGVNASVNLRIRKSSLKNIYTDGQPSGAIFILEIRAVILHKTKNNKIRFGGIGNASLHDEAINFPGVKKALEFSSIKFFTPGTNEEVIESYIGIYASSYGLDRRTRHIRYHDSDDTNKKEDSAMNGWIEYEFVRQNTEPVVKPVLNPVSVYSMRSNSIYGRTPDKFKYHIWYSSRANYEPIVFRLHILKNGKLFKIEPIKQVNQDDKNYRTPTEFSVIIEGQKLEEGYFQYQIVCRDKHTYAIGSKEDKEIYEGPYVVNNIPPQVRETAQTYIEMMEDDKAVYLSLKDFFVDADDDPLNYYIQLQNGDLELIYETSSLNLRIINNKNLKIEPWPNKFGKSTLTLYATDKIDPPANATHKLIVTVVPINDPPQIKTPFSKLYFFSEVRLTEDSYYSELNLTDVFHDPIEFDPLTFTVSESENLDIEIYKNGSVLIKPHKDWFGKEEIRFTATDPPGGSVYNDLKVNVIPVNDPPILEDMQPIIAYEDSWTNITFHASDPADHDTLIFSTDVAIVVNLKHDEYIFDQYNGKLFLFPPNRVATGGTYKVSVTVRDDPPEIAGKSLSVTKTVDITIRNTWDKPTCRIIEPKYDDKFLHFEGITFRGLVQDDDLKVIDVNEKITYEWFSDIDGKLGNAEEVHNVPLTAGTKGHRHKITFRVSDGKYITQSEIYIYVIPPDEKKDTDGDKMPDYWEERNGLNKYDSADADYDSDNDGFTNFEEYWYGKDGIADNGDPTDPWDDKDYPGDIKIVEEAQRTDYFLPLLFIVIFSIVMIIVIIITFLFISSSVSSAREYAERKHRLEEELKRQRQHKEDEKMYGIYSPKQSDVLCHNCGARNKVRSMSRPLAVTCEQCNTRGVVY